MACIGYLRENAVYTESFLDKLCIKQQIFVFSAFLYILVLTGNSLFYNKNPVTYIYLFPP